MDGSRDRLLGLIPAAGLSSRMGAFKPLLPFGGGTVIEAAVSSLLEGGAAAVTLVTGHRAAEIESVLGAAFPGRVRFVRNPDYAATDMLRSVQLGCGALPPCEGFFLLPGDMPAVRPETLRTLAARRPKAGPYILFPVLEGRRLHPPLISGDLIPDILAFRGEGGLRAFWATREEAVGTVAVTDAGGLWDLDTPEDYKSIQRFLMKERS